MSENANLSEQDIFESAPIGGGRMEPEPRDEPRRPDNEPAPANLGQLPDRTALSEDSEPQPAPQEPPRRSMLDDLKEERRKRQEFERQLAERDRQFAEQQGAMRQMQAMFGQMQGQGRQQPQAPQQAPQAPDPFEDPQGFAAFQARQVFEQQFQPFADQYQQREQQFGRMMAGMQRAMAVQIYGGDAAKEAEEAFNTAAARGAIDPYEHRRIQTADNPYTAAVEWHRRQRTFEQVGHDPAKWFETEFQRRAAEDPAFRQTMFGLLQGQAQQGQAQGKAAGASSPAAGKPPPIFTGLPSLNAAPGSSGRESGPISESDIFNAAPPRMGGRH